ncbi:MULTISPECIES: hypothetical protein [Paenibacillus]|uniref:Uncharacterized protein n=1 Tax=Paenibacillus apis TaxID=1792174 RepID=A0A919Y525_9BACL|nr:MULTISPECIES: hypothetical protein [Paenibacillus]GIO43403.1 hypothetical protein J41TS4_31610 [Paenibacillus apis]
MSYTHIMEIGYSKSHDKLGCIIVGGADPIFSSNNTKLPYLVDKYIMVKTTNEELQFKVKKMNVSTSISGMINIGITIYDSEDFSKIKTGNHVFVLLDDNQSAEL